MLIKKDNLESGEVVQLLEEHLADMYATSPPESVHALDVESLKDPAITFFSAWEGNVLMGCVAIKQLSNYHAELKSMRTPANVRGKGIGSAILRYVLSYCQTKGYIRLSLETGSMDFFKPARSLYEKFGFDYCEPFGEYMEDSNSQFMTKELS